MDVGTIEGAIIMRDLATAVLKNVEKSVGSFTKSFTHSAEQVQKSSAQIAASIGGAFDRVGQRMLTAGREIGYGLSAPIGAATGAIGKFGMDFEYQMKKIQVLAGVPADKIKDFSEQVLNLSKVTATGPDQLVEALYSIASVGFRDADALELLKVAAQGAAMGMGEAVDIAKALTVELTASGGGVGKATEAMDKFFVAVREGAAEAPQLAPTIGRVLGTARQLGVPFEETGGFIATLTRLIPNASEAVTSLGAVFSNLLKPSGEARNALEAAGYTAQDFRDAIADKGLNQALLELAFRLGEDEEAIAAVFGNVRALRGVLNNIGEQADAYTKNVEKMKNSSGEFGRGVQEMSTTVKWQWDSMVGDLKTVGIRLGLALKPAWEELIKLINSVIPYLKTFVEWFSKLPDSIKTAAVGLALFITVLGPLVWWLGNIVSIIGLLLGSSGFTGLTTVVIGTARGFKELFSMTKMFGLEGLSVTIGSWLNKIPLLVPLLKSVSGGIRDLWLMTTAFGASGFGAVISGWFSSLGSSIPIIGRVSTAIKELWQMTVAFGVSGFTTTISSWMTSLGSSVPLIGKVGDAFKTLGVKIAESASLIKTFKLEGVKLVLSELAQTIGNLVSKTPLLGTFAQGLINIANNLRGLSFTSIVNGLSGLWTWVVQLITKLPLLGSIFTFLTGPVGLVILGITALAVAIRLLTGSWDFLIKPIKYIADLFADLYVIAKDKLSRALSELADNVLAKLSAAWDWVKKQASSIYGLFVKLWESAKWLGQVIFDYLVKGFQALGIDLSALYPYWNSTVEWLGKVKDAVIELWNWFAGKLGVAFEVAGAWIAKALGKWNEWRAGIKETADEIRRKNKALEESGKAVEGVAKPVEAATKAVANASKEVAATATQTGTAASTVNKNATSMVEQLAKMRALLAGLTADQKANLDAGLAMGKNTQAISVQMNILYPKLRMTKEAVDMYRDSLQEGKKATREITKEIKDLIEQFTLAKKIQEFIGALKAVQEIGKGSLFAGLQQIPVEGLDALRKQSEDLLKAYESLGVKAPAALQAIVPQLQAVYNATTQLLALRAGESIYAGMIREINALLPVIGDLARATEDQLSGWMTQIDEAIAANRRVGLEVPQAWYDAKAAILAAQKVQELLNYTLDETTGKARKSAQELKAGMDAAAKGIIANLNAITKAQETLNRQQAKNIGGELGVQLFDWAQKFKKQMEDINYGMNEFGQVTRLGQLAVDALNQAAVADLEEIAQKTDPAVEGFGTLSLILMQIAALVPGIDLTKILSDDVLKRLNLLQGIAAAIPAGKDSLGTILRKGGFFDYLSKGGLSEDILRATQGGGNVGATIALGVSSHFTDILAKEGPDKLSFLGQALGTAGASFEGLMTGIKVGSETGSKSLGALAGAATGAAKGFAIAGPWGAAIGGVVGLIGGLIGAKKAAKKARDAFIESAGGLEKVKEMAKYAGISLDALMKAKSKKEVEKQIKALEEAIKKVQERVKTLTEDLGKMTQSGALMTADMVKRIKQDLDKPEIKQAFGEFLKANLERATAGLTTFLTKAKELPLTAQSAEAIGGALAGLFAVMREGGATALEALTALKDPIAAFEERLAKAGLSGGDAFAQLRSFAALASDEFAGPLLEAVSGLGDALAGLHNTGLLTESMFQGLAQQVGATYDMLQKQGKGGADALQLMQPTLQRLWELQQMFGWSVDEATQSLIDQAVESGIVGEKFKSAQDKMVAALDKLIGRFDLLLNAMGVQLPQAAEDGARGVEDALGSIRVPTIKIPVDVNVPEIPGGHYTFDAAMARGGVVQNPLVALVGENGPEAVIPLDRLFALIERLTQTNQVSAITEQELAAIAMRMAKYTSADTAHVQHHAIRTYEQGAYAGKQPEPVNVTFNITALDPIGMANVVQNEIAPTLVSLYQRNVNGLRTDTRRELVE